MSYSGRIALSVMVLVTFVFSGVVQATIYRWQDEEGNTHFTDDLTRVPPSQRDRVDVKELPEGDLNVTPAPSLPPVDEPAQGSSEPVDSYQECLKKAQEVKDRWTRQLEQDEDRLVELNRAIHRSTTSRTKNQYQRERVAVKDRIAKAEQMLRDKVPPMEQECETVRYWQGEE